MYHKTVYHNLFYFILLLIFHLICQVHFDLLRKFEANPEYTQRELSKEMGVSLGKVNYCIKKLVGKGWVKLTNFSHNPNKVGYAYLLTPKGIEEKTRLTYAFLKIKSEEYEMLKEEISKLKPRY